MSIALLTLCLTLPGPSITPRPGPERAQPDVLLIVVDDLGVEYLDWHPAGREGQQPAPTPFLSSVAKEALVFRQAYASPICSPSRSCLMTGRHAFRTGVGDNVDLPSDSLRLSEVTLAEQLRAAGYATGMFGKWHLSLEPEDPNLQGFDHFDGTVKNLTTNGYYLWPRVVDGVMSWEEEYATTVTTDSARDWIAAQRSSDGPWFALVAYHAPHQPFDPPPAALDPITRARRGDPLKTVFRGMVEALDHEVARLVADVGPDTLVIFVGDNGSAAQVAQPPVNRHRAKFTPYQGGILVPAMAWGATVERRGECGDRVHLVDFYRTILDAAGAPCDVATIDSISLLADGALPAERWVGQRTTLLAERFRPSYCPPGGVFEELRRAVLGPRYKLVQFDQRTELYDLEADPWEERDLRSGRLSPEAKTAFEELERELSTLLLGGE